MKKLIETIHGADCEVYGIVHHERILLGKAMPQVEIYEDCMSVPTPGAGIRCKRREFSIIFCPEPELNLALIAQDVLNGLTAFDPSMWLPRGADGVLVPFAVYGVAAAELSPEKWIFEINDAAAVKRLKAL